MREKNRPKSSSNNGGRRWWGSNITVDFGTPNFSISVYAEELNCDYKYIQAVKKVESFSSEMSEEAKYKWITQLKKAHQLYEEGKEEEAKGILSELRKDGDWDTVFSTHDGN